MYLNKIIIIGNLTKDPELRSLPDNNKVATFSIAVNEKYKDKQGNKVESVEFINCVAWGKAGELIAQYMKKGNQLLVSGKLRTSSWEDKETGGKKYKTEIIVRDFQFGYKNKENFSGKEPIKNNQEDEIDINLVGKVGEKEITTIEYPEEEINPEDIPF